MYVVDMAAMKSKGPDTIAVFKRENYRRNFGFHLLSDLWKRLYAMQQNSNIRQTDIS